MTTREIVYTVHKFEAENIDEISINVGEQVIVLEKDEGYNDGWWQGRNIRGETGLFPITYTVKQLPVTATLDNKIDSLEDTISKMKAPSTMQKSVHKSLVENKKPVEEWTSEQVSAWLVHVGFDQEIADNFKEQEISGDILLELTLDSLKELQVTTFGKRFKIHSAINVLRQESKKQNHSEARVNSPFPESTQNPISAIYNNKQQQSYVDDDSVSDYSTVIRNSHLPSSPKERKPSIISTRPSIPLDMDLIASSPRLSTLVERQGSFSSTHTTSNDRHVRPQQQPQMLLPSQQQQQTQIQQQQNQQQYNQRQKMNQPQRPVSHQHLPPPPSTNLSSDWKRNTMNNMKSQEIEEPKSLSTVTRYSFMRNSLLPNNKLQSVIPSTTMSRRSEDVVSLADVSVAPDMEGWLYKQGDKYKTWNKRWFVLKSNNLFYFKSPKAVRMKGIINLKGYRIEVDESIHPGKYCFKAHHEKERTFFFFTEFEKAMKEWLKALMKATISRDFATPVMSSNTIPTISLEMARKMRPRPPSTLFHFKDSERSPTPNYRIHNNLDQQFSLMALEDDRSRSSSAMHIRPNRALSPDIGLKDSGFNSAHGANLSRSITESSGSSTQKSITLQNTSSFATSPVSVAFYPDEEDEDLIDPEHMSVIEVNRYHQNESLYPHDEEQEIDHFATSMVKKQQGYIDWINSNIQKSKQISRISDLCDGDALIELLESQSGKEIMRPIANPSQSINVQSMDRIIVAFKFMSIEGVELDGACTARDILNGNGDKIMYMLDAIKYWSKNNSYEVVNGKKMASGGTFGEADQFKLRELEEETENILPPNTFASR